MLSKKQSGLFVEVGDFSVLVAQVNSLEAPLEISSLILPPQKTSICRPSRHPWWSGRPRVFSWRTAEFCRPPALSAVTRLNPLPRQRIPSILEEVVTQQFRMDARLNKTAVINAVDGGGVSPWIARLPRRKSFLFAACEDGGDQWDAEPFGEVAHLPPARSNWHPFPASGPCKTTCVGRSMRSRF